ncbi:hypothetical protein BD626DRAFT_480546 [Schizophyllum amplum]|uniref:Sensor domain-containing protein n=1 Tax=Schizophyllum amplum TaxID=97359 RepID=A0A550CT96_9AGAR|nr:hypothetical protein BD626DRAFT_480546 [Auriculariopsis ampla]
MIAAQEVPAIEQILEPLGACNPNDPPPPYPSREHRPRRARASRRLLHVSTTGGSSDSAAPESYSDNEARSSPPVFDRDSIDATETTPFLSPSSPRMAHRNYSSRPRSLSHSTVFSANSNAPSLAQTVVSLFDTDDSIDGGDESPRQELFARRTWQRYFRPFGQASYYRSLAHLLVLNFPYALAAWIYLFVFTLTGTILLVALPLGAVLCFFGMIGARAFARGELFLQWHFHRPLNYPAPYPVRPIFTRMRSPTSSEVEAGLAAHDSLVPERSFYKNTYSMATDPTTYQALFYFLVVKPGITLVLFLLLVAIGIPALVLVVTAPAAMRAVRRLGVWQANIAVEGLYLAVK